MRISLPDGPCEPSKPIRGPVRVRYGSAEPRLATPYLELPSKGCEVVELAAECGIDLLPWQVHAITEGMRFDPVTGKWARRFAGITAPRQNGKSALMRFVILWHLFKSDSQIVISMAQNRSLALEHFKMAVEFIEDVPWMAAQVKRVNRTNGQEALEIRRTDGKVAKWQIVAATMEGPRGRSADLLWIDELREIAEPAWKAATPLTRARPNAQTWVTSNAGDAHSTVLNELRSRALTNVDPSVGWWEWSAGMTDVNVDSAEFWDAVYQANPALGHMIDEDVIRQAAVTDSHAAFVTETLCEWIDSFTSPWPPLAWSGCADPDLKVSPGGPTWLGLDVSPDRRRADLVAVQLLEDGKLALGLVQSWTAEGAVDDRMIAGDVADWARKYQARAVAFDRWTGAGIASRLASVGIPVGDVSGQLFAQACDATLSSMTAGRLVHANQPDLTAAVMACAKKPMADGGWRVIRRGSAVHISAAVAMIMAIQYASEPQPTVEIITV